MIDLRVPNKDNEMVNVYECMNKFEYLIKTTRWLIYIYEHMNDFGRIPNKGDEMVDIYTNI
ncbi:hypothetical protein LINGRAHAP2_LOCUS10707 [Linum grandiflorum]